MKIIIFGATGSVGKLAVREALDAGHIVTAFVRNITGLGDLAHPELRLRQGDVLESDSVRRGIHGQDAVICAIGAGRKGIVRATGTHNIIKGMKQEGVSRLICQTTLGAGDSKGNLNFFWKHIMFGWILRDAYLDHELQEKYILESELDWIIVRPAALTNGPATGVYKENSSAADKTITLKISRHDTAKFLVQQLKSDKYLRKTPGLSY